MVTIVTQYFMTIHYRHFYATSTFTAWDQLLDETEAEAKVLSVVLPVMYAV